MYRLGLRDAHGRRPVTVGHTNTDGKRKGRKSSDYLGIVNATFGRYGLESLYDIAIDVYALVSPTIPAGAFLTTSVSQATDVRREWQVADFDVATLRIGETILTQRLVFAEKAGQEPYVIDPTSYAGTYFALMEDVADHILIRNCRSRSLGQLLMTTSDYPVADTPKLLGNECRLHEVAYAVIAQDDQNYESIAFFITHFFYAAATFINDINLLTSAYTTLTQRIGNKSEHDGHLFAMGSIEAEAYLRAFGGLRQTFMDISAQRFVEEGNRHRRPTNSTRKRRGNVSSILTMIARGLQFERIEKPGNPVYFSRTLATIAGIAASFGTFLQKFGESQCGDRLRAAFLQFCAAPYDRSDAVQYLPAVALYDIVTACRQLATTYSELQAFAIEPYDVRSATFRNEIQHLLSNRIAHFENYRGKKYPQQAHYLLDVLCKSPGYTSASILQSMTTRLCDSEFPLFEGDNPGDAEAFAIFWTDVASDGQLWQKVDTVLCDVLREMMSLAHMTVMQQYFSETQPGLMAINDNYMMYLKDNVCPPGKWGAVGDPLFVTICEIRALVERVHKTARMGKYVPVIIDSDTNVCGMVTKKLEEAQKNFMCMTANPLNPFQPGENSKQLISGSLELLPRCKLLPEGSYINASELVGPFAPPIQIIAAIDTRARHCMLDYHFTLGSSPGGARWTTRRWERIDADYKHLFWERLPWLPVVQRAMEFWKAVTLEASAIDVKIPSQEGATCKLTDFWSSGTCTLYAPSDVWIKHHMAPWPLPRPVRRRSILGRTSGMPLPSDYFMGTLLPLPVSFFLSADLEAVGLSSVDVEHRKAIWSMTRDMTDYLVKGTGLDSHNIEGTRRDAVISTLKWLAEVSVGTSARYELSI